MKANQKINFFALTVVATLGFALPAMAVVIQPSDVVATSSWYGPVSPDNLINGVGLSGNGSIAHQTHDNHGGAATMWHAGPNAAGLPAATGNPPPVDDQALVFTLPRLFNVNGAYIWNHSQNNLVSRGVNELEVFVSSDADPLNATFTSAGIYNLSEATGNGSDGNQTIGFGKLIEGVKLIKFDINSAHSGLTNDLVGLAEVRFNGIQQALTRKQFQQWGVEVHEEIVDAFQLPNQLMLAETAHLNGSTSGGVGGQAFAWPLSTQFRVYNSLAQHDQATYGSSLRTFSDEFHADYWSPSSSGGYYCCKGGGDRFYDDNAHIAVALAEAYHITGDQVFLDRAIDTFDFLLTGEPAGSNGGSYWSVQDHTFYDSAAALQGARAALMIYQATGDQQYMNHALRRYGWARDTTQIASGTFLEKQFLTGPKAGQVGDFDLVNFAGFGIAANVLFYETTGDESYLDEAQRIASTSLGRYFDGSTGRINDEGYWAFELVDSLVELYEVDGDQQWLDAVSGAMEWLYENKRDPNGHYGTFWGRNGPQTGTLSQWSLNEQASVARAFLRLGLADVPGDHNGDGLVDGADFLTMQRQGITPTKLAVWEANYGSTSDDLLDNLAAAATIVPEPSNVLLLIGLTLGLLANPRTAKSINTQSNN